jgi:hypothetical protein
MGLKLTLDIGEVRGHGSVLDGLAPELRNAVQASLAGAFQLAFVASGLLVLIALLVALGMRDLPLRTSSGSEPASLGH